MLGLCVETARPKQSSHAGKIHFFRKVQVCGFPKTTLPAWELSASAGGFDQQICIFSRFLKTQKQNNMFNSLSFACFFIVLRVFFEAFDYVLVSF